LLNHPANWRTFRLRTPFKYWQKEHQRFFSREGHFSEDMELIAEEFEVVEIL
ncbi:TPA: ASCH domain-containing protein, partial [Enterobacter hormaechei]|nr:ASCH domain-containing protein [Enterobacter hormaechei]